MRLPEKLMGYVEYEGVNYPFNFDKVSFMIVYDLFDFKFVIGHRAKSFLNETMEMVLQVTKNRIIIIL